MSKSIRDQMRAATVGAPRTFKRTEVEYNGILFEFVQPSLRKRKEIVEKCTGEDGKVDSIGLMVESVIALTVVPGTDERVYDEADRAELVDMPSGSFVDEFAEKAVQVLTGIGFGEEVKKD